MKRLHALSPLAMLFAATALAAPPHAAPATGPARYFTGNDLFNLEVATDPQISPDGRTIAYVRKSNDIMTDKARSTIWLVDAATGQQRPLLAGSGSYFSPRWSPDGSRLAYVAAEGGNPQLYVRWMAERRKRAHHRPARQPGSIAWSPGRRGASPIPCSCPTRAQARLGAAPSPKAPNGPTRSRSSTRSPTAPTATAISSPATTQIFWVPADGGAPTQLTFGATQRRRRASHGLRTAARSCSAPICRRTGSASRYESEIYRVSIDGGAPVALTSRDGPDNAPPVSPDGRQIAYVGFDDRKLGYQNAQAVGHEPRRLGQARAHRPLRPLRRQSGLVRRRPRGLRARTTTTAPTTSRASASTARSAMSRPA